MQRHSTTSPIPHTCAQCGGGFLAHKSAERLYCSKACYWQSKKKTEQRICPICSKTFEAWPSEPNRFCSLICRDIWQQHREERACKQCGQAFTARPSDKKIYCSPSCAAKASNATRKVIYPIHACAKCRKEFEYKRRDTEGKYCSRQCSDSVKKNPGQEWIQKVCGYCEKEFSTPPWQPETDHCSTKCASLHRAQSVRGADHPLWKDKVEMACKVCGKICQVKPSLVSRFGACSKRCAGILSVQSQQDRISNIEIMMQEAMQKIGLLPTPQQVIGYYVVDFAFIDQRLVVECDGDYWHNLPKQKIRDRAKDTYLCRHDWHIIRLTETDIRLSPADCAARVQAKLQSLTS